MFDHLHRKAYACLSSRTNIKLMRQVSQSLDYQLVTFEAFDHTDSPIYHTNVMLWIGTTVAAICADAISDGQARVSIIVSNTGYFHGKLALFLDRKEWSRK